MKFEDMFIKLTTNGVVEIAGGEIQIKKKLKEVIGNIPVYNIYVDFPKDQKEPIEFNNVEELNEYSIASMDGALRRCMECGEFPEKGYFYDYEMQQTYCSYTCLIKCMNGVYGDDGWRIVVGKDNLQFFIEVKSNEFNDDDLEYDYIQEDNRVFREYDCVYIPSYEDKGTTDDNGLADDMNIDIEYMIKCLNDYEEQKKAKEEKLVDNESTQPEN